MDKADLCSNGRIVRSFYFCNYSDLANYYPQPQYHGLDSMFLLVFPFHHHVEGRRTGSGQKVVEMSVGVSWAEKSGEGCPASSYFPSEFQLMYYGINGC